MEKEYRVSWLKVFSVTLVIFIIIGIIFFIYPKNKNKTQTATATYITNINLMKEAGFEYFQGSNLPEKIGSSYEMTLGEMIDSKLVMEFVDEKGKSCNLNESYIKTTKTLDNEYAMKVYLSCDSKSDYIVTSIANNVVCTNCELAQNVDTSTNNVTDNSSEEYYDNNYDKNGKYIGSTNTTSSTTNNKNTSSTNNYYYNTYNYNTNTNNNTNNNNNYNNCNNANCYCTDNCESNVYYSVNFDSAGGSYVARQLVKAGETADYRITTRSGYDFLGWYLNGQKYDFNTPVTQKITLVAKWGKADTNRYQVRFNPNNGENSTVTTVEDGDTVGRPNNPYRKCYRFLGWYLNGVKYDFSRPVYGDIVLEAKWEDDGTCHNKTYTVKFNSEGGSSVKTQTVNEGERAYKPSNPTKSGYTFIGWMDKYGNIFNFNNRIYENTTLYAEWEKNETKYNKYCKISEDRIYSTGYVGKVDIGNVTSKNFAYTLQYYKNNVTSMKVIDYGNISSLQEYNNAYNYWKNKGNGVLSMVGGSGTGIDAGSGSSLKAHALKINNMNPTVSYSYRNGNNWYFNVNVRLNNLNNIVNTTPFYTSSTYYVYFTPLYFDIEYTDLNNCETDLASKSSNYRNYEIVDTFYR